MSFTFKRTGRWLVLALISTLLPAASVAAQAGQGPANQPQTASAAVPPATDPVLEPSPLVVEAMNLRFHIPRGASSLAENLNGQLVVEVRDSPDAPSWTMRIQMMKPTNIATPSPKALVDDLLAKLNEANRPYSVLVNEPRTVSGLAGHLCFLDRVTHDQERYISGWLVLPVAADEFMVFAMQSLPHAFAAARPLFEASFGSIALRSRDDIRAEQFLRLEHGLTLLKSLTPEQLRALTGYKQWSRIYKPATAAGQGATEVGCALVEVLAAPRGALNPTRDPSKYTPAEREEGLLVRVQGRLIADLKGRMFYDSVALYWLAWDQSEETWSVRTTQRQGEAELSEAETGVRARTTPPANQATLQVIKSSLEGEPVPNEWEVPTVYLSQALGWVIGRLMPRDISEPREYAWYFYVAANMQPKMYQRLDRWEPQGDGRFALTTHLSPDMPPFVTTYAADGTFIRRTHADGSVTEPIALEELRRIWKAKGIPVSANER